MFFFEKKNQETFIPCRVLTGKARDSGSKVFLLLFLQKKKNLPLR
jgi:hypothetical protein